MYEKLATIGLDGDSRIQPVPLHVVGVSEEALFWKDIKRVLFSRAEFFVMCRVSRPTAVCVSIDPLLIASLCGASLEPQ